MVKSLGFLSKGFFRTDGSGLHDLLARHGLETFGPYDQRDFITTKNQYVNLAPTVQVWHTDGVWHDEFPEPGDEEKRAIICTSCYGTEFKTRSGIVQAKPFEVMLYSQAQLHRASIAGRSGRVRHFIRTKVRRIRVEKEK